MRRRDFTRQVSTALYGLPFLYSQRLDGGAECFGRISKTDTHVHLFDLNNLTYGWLDRAPEINRSFDLSDFRIATKKAQVRKILFMESGADAGRGVKEARMVQQLAQRNHKVKGIIAKLDLAKGKEVSGELDKLLELDLLRGVRSGFPKEADRLPTFSDGLKLLQKHQLTFDLLLSPERMEAAARLAERFPSLHFILDHFGNPDIQNDRMSEWRMGIRKLARVPNVICKMSGIITRIGKGWSVEAIKPYVLFAIEQFGIDRLVYGGDWPVVLRAGSYLSWAEAFEDLTRDLTILERRKIYHENADRIYRL